MNRFALPLSFVVATAAPTVSQTSTPPTPDIAPLSARIVPTPQQVAWQRQELAMFFHFGINTFTNQEEGTGKEDPKLFTPTALDCRQWAREAKNAGFKLLILTAKHHDGFCLWPSKYTEHSVKNAPWKDGKGDIVREFVDACRAENLKVGLYLSPWDKNSHLYGTGAYNNFFVNQLTELLTNYGPINEVWWDTELGPAADGKIPALDWTRFSETVKTLAPDAILNTGTRWSGNFTGVAPFGQSSVELCGYSGGFGGGFSGSGFGNSPPTPCRWRPVHCDTSLRPGWFYHASEDGKVKSLHRLLQIYQGSVGRNCVLMLNTPPDARGLLAEPDVQRLREFGAALREFQSGKLAAAVRGSAGFNALYAVEKAGDDNVETFFSPGRGNFHPWLELDFGATRSFNLINLREAISQGENVRQFRVDADQNGNWKTIAEGTVIGQRALIRLPQTKARRLMLVIQGDTSQQATPAIAEFSAHNAPSWPAPTPLPITAFHPAWSDSDRTRLSAMLAVDDDTDTFWSAREDVRECFLQVNLPDKRTFDRVTIHEVEPHVTRFAIEYQTADNHRSAAYVGDRAGRNFSVSFAPVTAQAIRLHIFDASAAPQIAEFAAWAP